MHVCMHACMYECMYECMNECMHILYLYIYIQKLNPPPESQRPTGHILHVHETSWAKCRASSPRMQPEVARRRHGYQGLDRVGV